MENLKRIVEIVFEYLTKDSEDLEIVTAHDFDLTLEKSHFLDMLDRKVLKLKEEICDIERKKKYFLNNFEKWFEPKGAN